MLEPSNTFFSSLVIEPDVLGGSESVCKIIPQLLKMYISYLNSCWFCTWDGKVSWSFIKSSSLSLSIRADSKVVICSFGTVSSLSIASAESVYKIIFKMYFTWKFQMLKCLLEIGGCLDYLSNPLRLWCFRLEQSQKWFVHELEHYQQLVLRWQRS